MSALLFNKADLRAMLAERKPRDRVAIVYDQGIYLCSPADEARPLTVVYARGCDPNKDADFWDNKRYFAGGDDGVDDISTVFAFRKHLHGDDDLKIYLTSDEIIVGGDRP